MNSIHSDEAISEVISGKRLAMLDFLLLLTKSFGSGKTSGILTGISAKPDQDGIRDPGCRVVRIIYGRP
jgi:hypothetical protein